MFAAFGNLSLSVRLLIIGIILIAGSLYYNADPDRRLEDLVICTCFCQSPVPVEAVVYVFTTCDGVVKPCMGAFARRKEYKSWTVLCKAGGGVKSMTGEGHREQFMRCLSDSNPKIRAVTPDYCSDICDDSMFRVLLANLRDPDPVVRSYTAHAIVMIRSEKKEKKTYENIDKYLFSMILSRINREEDGNAKGALLFALSSIDKEMSFPVIYRYIEDPNPGIRYGAMIGLASIRSDLCMSLAKKFRNDPDKKIRERARFL
ncbi:MAG: hypothetical protein LWY06_14405 [Firmicutes bacterium]|nr:hypothetical protein [Bacillota bacterium]